LHKTRRTCPFQLVSSRYEHPSLILTSNLPFARLGARIGDLTVAAAMTARIVHHANVHTLKAPATASSTSPTTPTLPSVRAEQAH
jgi:DNA replication protein DnaC